MIEIDGTYGEGGGQILRSSLSLAAITGQPMHITGIRAKRPNPGLMRQHLACVRAAVAVTGGNATGAELKSGELTFVPGAIRGGDYHFAVGTAGSVTLIAQTVIPILLSAETHSHVTIEGGTHTDHAPTFEFFTDVYLTALRKMGADVTAKMEKIGFYPAGGGRIVLDIQPIRAWQRFECLESGKLLSATLTAMGYGIDKAILTDEISIFQEKASAGFDFQAKVENVESVGPGNALYAKLEFEHITELFGICGSCTVSRDKVAERVAGMLDKHIRLQAPVGEFLADQLLLPMAIGAGGKYLTHAPSKHTLTNIEVIRKFLNIEVKLENCKNGNYLIEVKK